MQAREEKTYCTHTANSLCMFTVYLGEVWVRVSAMGCVRVRVSVRVSVRLRVSVRVSVRLMVSVRVRLVWGLGLYKRARISMRVRVSMRIWVSGLFLDGGRKTQQVGTESPNTNARLRSEARFELRSKKVNVRLNKY